MYLLTKQSVLFMLITKSSQDLRVPQINQMYTYRQPKKIKWCDPKDLGQNFFWLDTDLCYFFLKVILN